MLLPTVALSTVLGHLLMHAASLALEARSADAAGGRPGSGGSGGVAGGGSGGGGGGGGGGSGGGRGSGVFACGRRRDASRKASLASSLLENEGGEVEGAPAADAGDLVDAHLAATPLNTTVRGDGHA